MGTYQLLKEIENVKSLLSREDNTETMGLILEDYLDDLFRELDEHEKDFEDYDRYLDHMDRLRAVGQ